MEWDGMCWDAPATAGELLCPNHHSPVCWKIPALEPDELQVPPQPKPFQGEIQTPALGRSPRSTPGCPPRRSRSGERPSLRKGSAADRGGIGFSRGCQAQAGWRRVQLLNIHHCLNSVTLSAASGASAGPASPGSDGPIKPREIPADWGAPGAAIPNGNGQAGEGAGGETRGQ